MRCLVFMIIFLLAPAAQAQQACTQIGCMDGLTISVPLDYEWKPGAYTFDFLLDGRAVTCTGTLPLKSCETHSISCSAEGVMIMESGCAMPAQTHGFGDIMLGSGPRQVVLTIRHNRTQIARGNWTPKYTTLSPNGPACGPVCKQANVSLEMQ